MNTKAAEHLETLIRQMKELTGVYRDALNKSEVSENEFCIWYGLLLIEGECSQQELCERWSMAKQTVNTIIANGVKRGFMTLETVPGTRNRKMIRLTDEGRRYGEHIVMPIFQAEQKALERLPEEERTACMTVLGKYIRLLREELYEQHTTKNIYDT